MSKANELLALWDKGNLQPEDIQILLLVHIAQMLENIHNTPISVNNVPMAVDPNGDYATLKVDEEGNLKVADPRMAFYRQSLFITGSVEVDK